MIYIVALVCAAGMNCTLPQLASPLPLLADGSSYAYASKEACQRYADRWNAFNADFLPQGMKLQCVPKSA